MTRPKLYKRATGFACASAGERGASEDIVSSLPHGPTDIIGETGWLLEVPSNRDPREMIAAPAE